jgi:heme o synthase
MSSSPSATAEQAGTWKQVAGDYLALTKPRITLMAVFCALIGMLLASKEPAALGLLFYASVGIGLLAGAGFVLNCLAERTIDAQMARTRARPLARGEVSSWGALVFASVLGGLGAWVLLAKVNALTMWLTLATFAGYALVYTLILKPATPQNIVIGGASGAMPPLLGWTSVTGDMAAEGWLLVLIIFVWTPPHFWALALYRIEDYKRSGLPMLPVTHGAEFTRLNILLYTVLLLATCLLPYLIGMSGLFYLACAIVLNAFFMAYAWGLWKRYSDALARKTFRYSLIFLGGIFSALLIDHYH